MNQILQWLAGNDLRSDGMSNQAADFVLKNPEVLDDLLEGLKEQDDVIRGRTADALEKVARLKPEWLHEHVPVLTEIGENDHVAMVGMHLAMIFGHLANCEDCATELISALLNMLQDKKVFVKSWVISSLCIYARLYPLERERIVKSIAPLHKDPSIAIRKRLRYAMALLTDDKATFPKGWVKAEGLKYLEEGRAVG